LLAFDPTTGAITASPATSASWFAAPEVAAAALTALLTLAGILIKDLLLKRLEEGRSDRRAEAAIYERYSNPLVTSAISLMHRLNEILFTEHRPIYLQKRASLASGEGLHGSYLSYKRLSTAYRIASVLGWIRACRREFSYLRVAEPGKAQDVERAIGSFEKALADGGWVEQERASRLCELWQLSDVPPLRDKKNLERLGIKVNNVLWDILEESSFTKEEATELDDEVRQRLCRRTADCITGFLSTNPISEASIGRTWQDAFSIITMREAWIFRDWQSAIGDVMTRGSESRIRHFEVIGYGTFEQFGASKSERRKLALKRLLAVLDGLDISIQDRFDARPRQLRAVASATASLVLAIQKTQGKKSIVSETDVSLAENILSKDII
jgi:hypothetical protein